MDGKYKKVSELGDLNTGETSKEVKIDNKSIKKIYIFSDYLGTIRADISFLIIENKMNQFVLPSGIKGISVIDKTDPTQYPN